MWNKTISSKEFVVSLGQWDRNEGVQFNPDRERPTAPTGNTVCLVWFDEVFSNKELPHAMVVAEDHLSQFLSLSATYFSSLRPLTSYVRVMTPAMFTAAVDGQKISTKFSDVFVAAVIAEVITEVRSREVFDSLSVNSFTSTYSYSMARCLTLFDDRYTWNNASIGWFIVRDWTKQQARRAVGTNLTVVWELIRHFTLGDELPPDLPKGAQAIVLALRDIQLSGHIQLGAWKNLTNGLVSHESLLEIHTEPREDRLRAIEQIFALLRAAASDHSYIDDFICGYLVSLVSDGTFEHAEMLFPMLDEFPTALTWYGICASLNKIPKLDTWKPGLHRRLVRELTRALKLGERPQSDISFHEFEVIRRSSNRSTSVLQANAKILNIELVPGVEQSVSWPHKVVEPPRSPMTQNRNEDNTKKQLQQVAEQIQRIIKQLDQDPSVLAVKEESRQDVQFFDEGKVNTRSVSTKPVVRPKAEGLLAGTKKRRKKKSKK